MKFITGSKKILLHFYFKNNTFKEKDKLESYYIKPYFIKSFRETIINCDGIYKLYYSEHSPTDKIIAYKEHNEHPFHR